MPESDLTELFAELIELGAELTEISLSKFRQFPNVEFN